MFRVREGDRTIEIDTIQELVAYIAVTKVRRRRAHPLGDSDKEATFERAERKRAYQREWRAKNKEKLAARRRKYYESKEK